LAGICSTRLSRKLLAAIAQIKERIEWHCLPPEYGDGNSEATQDLKQQI